MKTDFHFVFLIFYNQLIFLPFLCARAFCEKKKKKNTQTNDFGEQKNNLDWKKENFFLKKKNPLLLSLTHKIKRVKLYEIDYKSHFRKVKHLIFLFLFIFFFLD